MLSKLPKIKLPHKYRVYDFLHQTFVTGCVIATLMIGGRLVYDAQHYVRKKRPMLLEEDRLKREQTLSAQQLEKQEELLIQERLQEKAGEVLKEV